MKLFHKVNGRIRVNSIAFAVRSARKNGPDLQRFIAAVSRAAVLVGSV